MSPTPSHALPCDDALLALRTILDHVSFGLLLVDRRGLVCRGYSRSCEQLLGMADMAGHHLARVLRLPSEAEAAWLGAAIEQIVDDVLPEEVALQQLPRRVHLPKRTLGLEARVVRSAAREVTGLLFSIMDRTDLEAAEIEVAQNKMLIFMLRHRAAFRGFVRDTWVLLRQAHERFQLGDAASVRQLLHTIKGNAASFELRDLVQQIHLVESEPQIGDRELRLIRSVLRAFLRQNADLFGSLDELDQAAPPPAERARAAELLAPAQAYIEALAARLGKSVRLVVRGGELLVDEELLAPVLRALTHVLRNAVDHGVEWPHERGSKPARATVEVALSEHHDRWEIDISDDGRGMDVEALSERALAQGKVRPAALAEMSEAERLGLVFLEGVTTRKAPDELSGRGVGMAALAAAVHSIGGRIRVTTGVGVGTTVHIEVDKLPHPQIT